MRRKRRDKKEGRGKGLKLMRSRREIDGGGKMGEGGKREDGGGGRREGESGNDGFGRMRKEEKDAF